MASVKPTIALIPGAWHTPTHYATFLSLLSSAGYPTTTIQLPSVGSSDPDAQSTSIDAAAVREKVLLPLLNSGKDVVLVMHSYGGSPGSAAAKGLSKTERSSNGSGGGIIGLIYLAGLVIPKGASLLSSLPGAKFDPWVIVNEETGQLDVEDPANVFYHDVAPDGQAAAISALKLQSRTALSTPSSAPAWPDEVYNGRRGYVVALQDHTIPTIAQQMMMKFSGVEWNVKEINTSHSPFVSQPEQLVKEVVELIEELS